MIEFIIGMVVGGFLGLIIGGFAVLKAQEIGGNCCDYD